MNMIVVNSSALQYPAVLDVMGHMRPRMCELDCCELSSLIVYIPFSSYASGSQVFLQKHTFIIPEEFRRRVGVRGVGSTPVQLDYDFALPACALQLGTELPTAIPRTYNFSSQSTFRIHHPVHQRLSPCHTPSIPNTPITRKITFATMSTLEELDDLDRQERDDKDKKDGDKKDDKDGKKASGDGDAEMEDAEEEDPLAQEVLSLSTQDIQTRKRLLENDSRIMKSEFQRLQHEKATMTEKIKDNREKIQNNRYVAHAVLVARRLLCVY